MHSASRRDDPWFARLAFHVLESHAAVWITVWLLLILGAVVLTGPVIPAVLGWIGAAVAGGAGATRAINRVRRNRQPP